MSGEQLMTPLLLSRTDRMRLHDSNLISTHELGQLRDEDMTDEERQDLETSEAICRRFLKWNMDVEDKTGLDIKTLLAEVLGRDSDMRE